MKQKVCRAVKKRFVKTQNGKGKIMRAKASHNHRLIPKTKERKAEAGKMQSVSLTDKYRLRNELALI